MGHDSWTACTSSTAAHKHVLLVQYRGIQSPAVKPGAQEPAISHTALFYNVWLLTTAWFNVIPSHVYAQGS